jgi:hypothetical protein
MVETSECESWFEVGAQDYDDFEHDDFEPDEDYFREEHWRVLDLAAEEMDSAAVPPVVYGLALKHRADSIEVKGEPDWEYEDGEYLSSSPGSYREVFHLSPKQAIAEGWRIFREIVRGFRLPASPLRPHGRVRRRGVRVTRRRRTTATRGSPGRSSGGDDPPPHPHVADPRRAGVAR